MAIDPAKKPKRTHSYPAYELIDPSILDVLAKRLEVGRDKYPPGDKWKHGDPEWYRDAGRHIIRHALAYLAGEVDDDDPSPTAHIGAMAFGVQCLAYYEAHKDEIHEAATVRPLFHFTCQACGWTWECHEAHVRCVNCNQPCTGTVREG